jgi:hypothetical protein
LHISRERMVGYEVVHRDERKRRLGIGPRNWPMTGGVEVVMGRRAHWMRLGDDWWARIVGDRR